MNKTGRRGRRQPKAYEDTRFLQSRDARALRILAEYLEPLYRFERHNVQDTIVFMGSARLRSEEAAKYGAIISLVGGHLEPLPFEDMINPQTKRMTTRRVNVNGEGYECARRYMLRLEKRDLDDPPRLARLAETVQLSPEQFRQRFGYLIAPA